MSLCDCGDNLVITYAVSMYMLANGTFLCGECHMALE